MYGIMELEESDLVFKAVYNLLDLSLTETKIINLYDLGTFTICLATFENQT